MYLFPQVWSQNVTLCLCPLGSTRWVSPAVGHRKCSMPGRFPHWLFIPAAVWRQRWGEEKDPSLFSWWRTCEYKQLCHLNIILRGCWKISSNVIYESGNQRQIYKSIIRISHNDQYIWVISKIIWEFGYCVRRFFFLGSSVRLGEWGANLLEGPEHVGFHTENQSLVWIQVSCNLTNVTLHQAAYGLTSVFPL